MGVWVAPQAPFFTKPNNIYLSFYMVQLSVFDDMGCCSEEEVQRMLPLVSPQRRQEALRFKHLFGRFTCLKSYMMLHEMLVKQGLIPATCLPEFERNQHGKPEFKGVPGIYFNLSHTRQAIAVALSDSPVGVDVEGFKQPKQSLLEYTMSDEEIRRVQLSPHPDQEFALLWTQKEALFKYAGTGITSSIKNLLTPLPPSVTLQSTLYAAQGYALSLAFISPSPAARCGR